MLYEITEACNADDRSPELYALFKKLLSEFVRDDVLAVIGNSEGGELLEKMVNQWSSYIKFTMLLSRVFSYVDRNYLRGNTIPSLG